MKPLPFTLYSSIVCSPSTRFETCALDSISAMVSGNLVTEAGGSGGGTSSRVLPGGSGRGVDWAIADAAKAVRITTRIRRIGDSQFTPLPCLERQFGLAFGVVAVVAKRRPQELTGSI